MSDGKDSGRKQRRVGVATRVRLKADGPVGMVHFFTKNLSKGGLFIQTPKPLPIGRKIALQFHDPKGTVMFEAMCVVAWVRDYDPDSSVVPGMGLKFVSMSDDGRRFIEKVLKTNRDEEPPQPREELFEEAPIPVAPPPAEIPEPVENTPPSQPVEELFGEPISFDDDDIPIEVVPPEPEPQPAPPPVQTPPAAPATPDEVEVTPPSGTPAPAAVPAPTQQPQLQVVRPKPRSPALTYPPSELVLGIDLGTTYSCAAVVRNGRPEVILSDQGHRTIPSVVHVGGDNIIVGWAASDKVTTHPQNTIYGSKRLLSRQFTSQAVRDAQTYFDYKVVADPNGEAAVQIDDKIYPFDWVAMRILHEITVWAREHTKSHITKAVVAVPAYYNGRQRQAVINAAREAGLEVLQIINEPTAASIAYGVDRSETQLVMVYDLGGGTFDASLLLMQGNVFQVLATAGDPYLGGVDFDHRITDWMLVEFEQQTGINLSNDPIAKLRVREAAEAAKRNLSGSNKAQISLPFITRHQGEGVNLDLVLSREVFEKLINDLVDRTIIVCAEMFRKVGRRPDEVGLTLLVGGQTRTPYVQAKVSSFMGKPPRKGVHPDESVALGAALLGEGLREVDRLTLLDVVSMPIGVAMPDGNFREVIPANTRLPVDKNVTLRTFQNQQTRFEVDVFQGAESRANANEYLGTIVVDGLPPMPAGQLLVQFTFSMDAQGFLLVTAIDTVGGQLRTLQLETQDTPDALKNMGIPPELLPDPEKEQDERRKKVAEALARYTAPRTSEKI